MKKPDPIDERFAKSQKTLMTVDTILDSLLELEMIRAIERRQMKDTLIVNLLLRYTEITTLEILLWCAGN